MGPSTSFKFPSNKFYIQSPCNSQCNNFNLILNDPIFYNSNIKFCLQLQSTSSNSYSLFLVVRDMNQSSSINLDFKLWIDHGNKKPICTSNWVLDHTFTGPNQSFGHHAFISHNQLYPDTYPEAYSKAYSGDYTPDDGVIVCCKIRSVVIKRDCGLEHKMSTALRIEKPKFGAHMGLKEAVTCTLGRFRSVESYFNFNRKSKSGAKDYNNDDSNYPGTSPESHELLESAESSSSSNQDLLSPKTQLEKTTVELPVLYDRMPPMLERQQAHYYAFNLLSQLKDIKRESKCKECIVDKDYTCICWKLLKQRFKDKWKSYPGMLEVNLRFHGHFGKVWVEFNFVEFKEKIVFGKCWLLDKWIIKLLPSWTLIIDHFDSERGKHNMNANHRFRLSELLLECHKLQRLPQLVVEERGKLKDLEACIDFIVNSIKRFKLLILTFFVIVVNCNVTKTPITSTTTTKLPSYEEFKALVPSDIYEKLVKIYSNKSLLVVDKLKDLDDIFMSLPESILSLLPTPKAFRKLDNKSQENIRRIYYSKRLGFEEKLKAMEDIMHTLPPDQLKLIPLQNDIPGLLEFDVPVLLQFNGQFETYLLRNYLNSEEYEILTQIVNKKNIPEVSRARLVGRLLRDAYHRSPETFPIPLGDNDPQVPEEIRRLGIHLMFSKEPFSSIDLFSRALNILKSGNKKGNGQFNKLKNTLQPTQQEDCPNTVDNHKQYQALLQFIQQYNANDNIYEL